MAPVLHHSLNKYVLSTYYVPEPVPGSGTCKQDGAGPPFCAVLRSNEQSWLVRVPLQMALFPPQTGARWGLGVCVPRVFGVTLVWRVSIQNGNIM